MGGFSSVSEGMPSGNNSPASTGVPLGNSTGESGFAPPPLAARNDWTAQALMPAATPLVQQQGISEADTSPSNNPFAPSQAAKPSDNPVPLSKYLAGGNGFVEPQEPQRKSDEWPKMPKVDWGKHRIDGPRRAVHDDWARLIASTKDFGGILPTFKYHIDHEGDAGRADAADMLWRVAQKDPAHARYFQRELTKALDGETIPIQRALMVGEEAPDSSASPGLLGARKPMTPGLADAIKNYPQMREDYLAEFERRQQETQLSATQQREEPPSSEPPQLDGLGKRGVVFTNPENPAYPDRGNFAEKLAREPKGDNRQPSPKPDFHPSVTLEFDGKELRAVENGKVIQSWSGVSGRPGFQSPDHQGERNKGPLPEGDWMLRQGGYQQIPQGGLVEWMERIKNWRGGEDAWGKERVWVDTLPGTDTKGRTGFSVHGGKDPGSAGCIDMTGQMGQFAEYFRSLGKDVKIRVRYPRE